MTALLEYLNLFDTTELESGPANAGLCHRVLRPCLVLQPYRFYYVWYSNVVLVVVNV